MPADVIAFYGLLVVWAALLVLAVRRKRFGVFLAFGLGLMVLLNLRYFLAGQPAGIRFFIGLYDTFDNLGLPRGQGAPALAPCDGNACTVWDARFTYHPSWGVAFYDRFVDPPTLRKVLLYLHIAFNSAALLLMHVQLARPGFGERRRRHVVLGRVTFGVLTIGTACAVVLASEHGAVPDYGGLWAQTGSTRCPRSSTAQRFSVCSRHVAGTPGRTGSGWSAASARSGARSGCSGSCSSSPGRSCAATARRRCCCRSGSRRRSGPSSPTGRPARAARRATGTTAAVPAV